MRSEVKRCEQSGRGLIDRRSNGRLVLATLALLLSIEFTIVCIS